MERRVKGRAPRTRDPWRQAGPSRCRQEDAVCQTEASRDGEFRFLSSWPVPV